MSDDYELMARLDAILDGCEDTLIQLQELRDTIHYSDDLSALTDREWYDQNVLDHLNEGQDGEAG